MGKRIRSDIPYRDRLLMEKFNKVAEHRNDAARTALKISCVALNNTEKMGYFRLIRFAEEQQKLTEEYYMDPEVGEAHLNETLQKIGFVTRDGRLLGAVDAEGKPVKAAELAEEDVLNGAGGERRGVQLWSNWVRTADRTPKEPGEYIVVIKDGATPTVLLFDGTSWFEEDAEGWRTYYKVRYWMPLPEPPTV